MVDGTIIIGLVIALVFIVIQLTNAPHYRQRAIQRELDKKAQLQRRMVRAEKPRPKSHRR